MPNWCSNQLSIVGPLDKVKALYDEIESKDKLLEVIKPIGEWEYEKAVEQWGTKWDVQMDNLGVTEISDGRAELCISFESAWAPPIDAFKSYSSENKDLEIILDYYEPGMAYVGQWTSNALDRSYEIDVDNLDNIPEDIRENWDLDSQYDWLEDGEDE